MAVDHYENFPVASLLLPRRLRPAVRDIYRYARSADDIADEGDLSATDRLEALGAYRQALQRIAGGAPALPTDDALAPVFNPLAQTIERHKLPIQDLLDLLSAFEQDVTVNRYADRLELLDYCNRSANPVGRLMLHLYHARNNDTTRDADAICTGLQLTNFWQDVAIDWAKGRVYIPLDAMSHYGVPLSYIERRCAEAAGGPVGTRGRVDDESDVAWRALMQDQVEHARGLLLSGLPLTRRLPRRIGLELKLVVHGGLRILERLDQLHYDIFLQRPTLAKRDWIRMFWRALG